MFLPWAVPALVAFPRDCDIRRDVAWRTECGQGPTDMDMVCVRGGVPMERHGYCGHSVFEWIRG
jgi:hypothetical protein